MAAQPGNRMTGRSGITLIEMLAFMLLLGAIFLGLVHGIRWGAHHGKWMPVVGGILGAVVGGVGFFAAMFLVLSPFSLHRAIKRSREPASLICVCGAPGRTVPERLNPHKPIELEAATESHKVWELPELSALRAAERPTEERLRLRLAQSPGFSERIALAAQLGEPAALAVGIPPCGPLLHYTSWAKLPPDLQATLRSGLPPRLCLVWALACAERALAVFEHEFHEDKRPRIAFGAALQLLKRSTPDALALCRPPALALWSASEAGCRVLHRDFWTRFRGCRSKGELALEAVRTMARSAADFVEPTRLWAVYSPGDMANGYETPQNRCAWSNPGFHAEDTAYEAALAADHLEREFQFQRDLLARLILTWDRWEEDRQDWQRRVEQEWIPKVQQELKGAGFDVPAYVERLHREWIPWRLE